MFAENSAFFKNSSVFPVLFSISTYAIIPKVIERYIGGIQMLSKFRNFGKNYPHIWTISYFVIYLIWFVWLESRASKPYHVIHFPLDDYIPFCEYFVIPYFLWFVYIAAVFFMAVRQGSPEFLQVYCFSVYRHDLISRYLYNLSERTFTPSAGIQERQYFYQDGMLPVLGRYLNQYTAQYSCV